jgi:hypothetical protein
MRYAITTPGRNEEICMNVDVDSLKLARIEARKLAKAKGQPMYINRVTRDGSTWVETVKANA